MDNPDGAVIFKIIQAGLYHHNIAGWDMVLVKNVEEN